MLKKYLLFLLVLLIPMASAQIIISPLNLSVKTNTDYQFSMNITNTFNFDIYKLTFSNLPGFSFPEINIPSGQTKNITFSVRTNYSYDGNINSKVSFRYLANIPEEVRTYNLSITSSGIDGKTYNYITIRKGDTITWFNRDSITYELSSPNFNSNIAPGNYFSKYFDVTGLYDYRALISGITMFSGTIEVINRTGSYLVYNQDYDSDYSINLFSSPEKTYLNISATQDSFNIDATSYKEGLLTITNTGNFSADNIILSSDKGWITFDENNFNLASNDFKYIKFKISPIIFENNQTNKTYSLNMNIKGLNTDSYSKAISVYIPYSNIFGDITSEEGFLNWFAKVYCPQNPNSFLCNTSSANQNNTPRVIYRDPEHSLNLTDSELRALITSSGKTADTLSRLDNKFTTGMDEIKGIALEARTTANESLRRQIAKEQRDKKISTALWIIGSVLFLCICVLVIIISTRRLNKKEDLAGVQFYGR